MRHPYRWLLRVIFAFVFITLWAGAPAAPLTRGVAFGVLGCALADGLRRIVRAGRAEALARRYALDQQAGGGTLMTRQLITAVILAFALTAITLAAAYAVFRFPAIHGGIW